MPLLSAATMGAASRGGNSFPFGAARASVDSKGNAMSIMLSLVLIAAGAGVFGGILAGLLGVGGGIVIVPALYFAFGLLGISPDLAMRMAVGTSLATIIFTALSSSWGHFRRGAVDMDLLRRWAPFLLLGVLIGSGLGSVVSGRLMMAVFAGVAILVATDMIARSSRKPPEAQTLSLSLWRILGTVAGAISAMMGIGGGTVCVPILRLLGYDIRKAVGTSAAIGLIIALPGSLVYAATGFGDPGLPPYSLGYVNLVAAAVIIPLTTLFAQVGAKIAHSIPPRALQLCFAVFLMLTGLRMLADLLG